MSDLLQVLCFSKDRPLQLQGYLRSLYSMADHDGAHNVSVLLAQPYGATCPRRADDFATAYADVMREFPAVEFVEQVAFDVDLSFMLDDSVPYTLFGVDDAIYYRPFSARAIVNLLERRPDLLGVSLRLGRNISTSMFYPGQVLEQPTFESDGRFLCWDIGAAGFDWGYPWELDGTLYPTTFVRDMLTLLGGRAQTPNQLEAFGAHCWQQVTSKRTLAAYECSRLVVPTVNVVQHDFPNHPPGAQLSTELLLDYWQQGIRLDLTAFDHDHSAIHIGDLYLSNAA